MNNELIEKYGKDSFTLEDIYNAYMDCHSPHEDFDFDLLVNKILRDREEALLDKMKDGFEAYIEARKELVTGNNRRLTKLNVAYSKAHNGVKHGCIVEDHIGRIRVTKIIFGAIGSLGNQPQCIYRGVQINRDGSDRKKGDIMRDVWQCNLKGITTNK